MTDSTTADLTVTPEVRDGQVVGYQVEDNDNRRVYLRVDEDQAVAKFLAATQN